MIYVIPARAGSKGVPYKNFRLIGSSRLNLVEITLIQLHCSGVNGRVIVSTDLREPPINRRIFELYGSSLEIHLRSGEAAGDLSPVEDTLHELVEQNLINKLDDICLLQTTTPLRQPTHIQDGVAEYLKHKKWPVVSVVRVGDNHPDRMYRQTEDQILLPLTSDRSKRRQDLEPLYLRSGQFYIFNYSNILSCKITNLEYRGVVCNPDTSLNIDEISDWDFLEYHERKGSLEWLKRFVF